MPLKANVHFSSQKQDWGTPVEFFDKLDDEFHFALDVCATEGTAGNAKCVQFITPEEDAFEVDWFFPAFMNPPYGRKIGLWLSLAWEKSRTGVVVCLVPSRTDTAWWHDYCMRGEIRFIRGRLVFEGAVHNAPFPSAIVIFRPEQH